MVTDKKKKKKEAEVCAIITITDADHIDELTLLANTPAQADSSLHSQEQTRRIIGPYVDSDKP